MISVYMILAVFDHVGVNCRGANCGYFWKPRGVTRYIASICVHIKKRLSQIE